MKIAWIGTGVMGAAMAAHVRKAGHEVHAYNRTYEKALPLQELGIQLHQDIASCVKDCDFVFTIVGYPKDVKEVYCGAEGIFASINKGCICVDMTTSSPQLATTLYEIAKCKECHMIDAPVSGGDHGAKAGTLSIMAGGDEDIYEQCVPIFQTMGNAKYMGKAGNGQHTKACNQIAVAGAVAAMSEAIVYAKTNHVDPLEMLEAISKGAAGSWQIDHTAPRVMAEDFAPGFFIKHFIKDMHIIQDEMQRENIKLEMLDTVCHMYEALASHGEEENGTQALLHYYQ